MFSRTQKNFTVLRATVMRLERRPLVEELFVS